MNMRRAVRIATVCTREGFDPSSLFKMDRIRWLRISQSLANLGYQVDIIADAGDQQMNQSENPKVVPYDRVDWDQYDVIKTLFHAGFQSLSNEGQDNHPFVISKLGSVVGATDDAAGVHFFGDERKGLYEIQNRIVQKAKYVTLLTDSSIRLWRKEYGCGGNILKVPTGVDREIPPPKRNPYRSFSEKIAVYLGNIYEDTQREVNLYWQERFNSLGKRLRERGIRFCFVGTGKTDRIDHGAVTCLGTVPNERIWDYQYFAHAGIALAQGALQHNESSKIYYYLRTGLPVVSEAPIPNNQVIVDANLGYLSPWQDDQVMADMIEEAVHRKWDQEHAMEYVLKNHTWDARARVYDRLFRETLGHRRGRGDGFI
jgi:glycosyltransferase involved in cell wall biosynthesis